MPGEHPLHILFVEDEAPDADLAARELEKSGLEFTRARVDSAPALLDALTTRCPDLIISDYAMPGFSGMEALSLSRAHDASIPFLVLTGSQSEATAVACLKAGAWDYVLKDHAARLPFAVREALSRKRARAERLQADEARYTLEAALASAQKMEAVGRLAEGVSHEFNNVLTGILGFCDLLLSSMPAVDPYRADVLQIQAVALRASTLSRQLLAFSRKQPVQAVRLNVTALLGDLRKPFRSVIREHIQAVWDLASDLPEVVGDPGQIEQALYNLVTNAEDAMPDGGRLTIRTARATLDEGFVAVHPGAREGQYVALSIADTGTGIDPRLLPTVFEPFVTTKADRQGAGLGLAAVYGIVKQMGGYVTAQSAPGLGSTFTLYFPESGGAVASSVPGAGTPTGARGTETILLVEDDESVRTLLRRALEPYGYTVLEAVDGHHAVSRWRDHGDRVDLLITDLVMPGPSGADLIRQFRETRPALPALLMTGYADPVLFADFQVDDLTLTIKKPFLRREVIEQIRRLTGRRGAAPPAPSSDG